MQYQEDLTRNAPAEPRVLPSAKIKAAVKTTTITLALVGGTAIGGGALLVNVLQQGGSVPTVSEFTHSVEGSTFSYRFVVANPKNEELAFTLSLGEEIIRKIDVTSPATYAGSFDALASGDYTASILKVIENASLETCTFTIA